MVPCHSNPALYIRLQYMYLTPNKYESFRITLTWSNAPSVSYCETFLSSSETSSTIQDSFTKPWLTRIQCSREELLARGSAMRTHHLSVTLSIEFADADTAQKAHYCPIPITNLIISASLLSSTHVINCATDFSPLHVHIDYRLPHVAVLSKKNLVKLCSIWEHTCRIDFNFVGVLDHEKNFYMRTHNMKIL